MIILFTSGSGGHIEPAILLNQRLKKKGIAVKLIIGNSYPKSCDAQVLNLPRKKILLLLYLPVLCWSVMKYFILRRPRLVIGFGGFQSLPVLFIARILGCKIAIYEPNINFGKANRLLLPFVNAFFLIWIETVKTLSSGYLQKMFLIRPLIRESKKSILPKQKFNIVVFGGSQGSQFLNNLAMQLLCDLQHLQNIKLDLITGQKFYHQLITQLSKLNTSIEYHVHDFCSDMSDYYLNADFLITRAGAQTIVELISYCKPAMLIPYPYAGGHQLQNARYLLHQGCCLVVNQEKIDGKVVKNIISAIIRNPRILQAMKRNLENLKQELFTNLGMEDVIVRFL